MTSRPTRLWMSARLPAAAFAVSMALAGSGRAAPAVSQPQNGPAPSTVAAQPPSGATAAPSATVPVTTQGIPQGSSAGAVQGGRLEAKYEASLAGIPVGKGNWTIEITDDQYTAAAAGGTAGLLKAFAGGSGSGMSTGRVVAGALVPSSYTAVTTSSKKSETIRMLLTPGYIKDFSIEPEPPVDPEKIPVTDAHRRNVIDPMTGSLLRVPGAGEVLTADACRTGTSIFDGRMRYDLKLDYKRMESVKAEKGYHGPAIVCAVYFTPIAGYVPDRAGIKYLAAQRNIEAWLVPIAGTRVLVPYRMTIPTPLGTAMLEAVEFTTTATPPKAAAKTN